MRKLTGLVQTGPLGRVHTVMCTQVTRRLANLLDIELALREQVLHELGLDAAAVMAVMTAHS